VLAIVLKALARRAEDRYRSAQELIDDLRRWEAGAAVEAPTLQGPPAGVGKPATVRVELPDGRPVTVTVDAGAVSTGKVAVQVRERPATRKRPRRWAVTVVVSLSLLLVLVAPVVFQFVAQDLRRSECVVHCSREGQGQFLAVAAEQDILASAAIWERRTLQGHAGRVTSVADCPDGRTLCCASADRTLRVWDVKTGQERATLQGHASAVWSVAFSADGKSLASGSEDGTVKLWDVASGRERATLRGH
jgi:hypothetical protein